MARTDEGANERLDRAHAEYCIGMQCLKERVAKLEEAVRANYSFPYEARLIAKEVTGAARQLQRLIKAQQGLERYDD